MSFWLSHDVASFTIHMHRCSQCCCRMNTHILLRVQLILSFFFHSFLWMLCVCVFFQLKSNENGLPERKREKTASNPWSQCAHNVINLNSMPENQKLIKYIYAHCVWLRACIMWIQFTQYILFKSKNTWIAFGGANLFPFEITLYCVLYRTNCKWYIFV